MANIVVTYDDNNVYVDFGDYAYNSGQPQAQAKVQNNFVRYKRSDIRVVAKDNNEDFVKIRVEFEFPDIWKVTYPHVTMEAFVIDSVNGVAPTDNTHLRDLLKVL